MTNNQQFLSAAEIKFLYGYPSRDHSIKLHWRWLEAQLIQSLRDYVKKLEYLDGFGLEFIFSRPPDMRTKKGVLEVIERYYGRIGI